jgi:hypothetical protein
MRVLNQQWRDYLASAQYPFLGAGPILSNDGFTVPSNCFLDLNLLVDQTIETVFLVSITTSSLVPAIATFALPDGTVVGTCSFLDIQSNHQIPIKLGTAITGVAVVDPTILPIINGWGPGIHSFTGVQVMPHLLVALDRKWRRGFLLPDGTILEGDVYFVADLGLKFDRTSTGFALNVTGDPYNGRTRPARALYSVNLVGPQNGAGNLNLVSLGVAPGHPLPTNSTTNPFRLSIKPSQAQIQIELDGNVS